jgi:hypothetical protein
VEIEGCEYSSEDLTQSYRDLLASI